MIRPERVRSVLPSPILLGVALPYVRLDILDPRRLLSSGAKHDRPLRANNLLVFAERHRLLGVAACHRNTSR